MRLIPWTPRLGRASLVCKTPGALSHKLLGGGDDWKPGLSWILLHQPLTCVDFNARRFALTNGTMSVTALLSSVGPSGELLNLRVVLGTPDISQRRRRRSQVWKGE